VVVAWFGGGGFGWGIRVVWCVMLCRLVFLGGCIVVWVGLWLYLFWLKALDVVVVGIMVVTVSVGCLMLWCCLVVVCWLWFLVVGV